MQTTTPHAMPAGAFGFVAVENTVRGADKNWGSKKMLSSQVFPTYELAFAAATRMLKSSGHLAAS